ncbi:olfactory receptor 2G3-like [Tachyglossus aculeatus]|uniref:olfactory receptor 2G3-like n=1 Tax=Tachyglossus aculeatus TaxID=9261 RepID=UPI0018F5555A|nr:olfactory receptor 2G3-like [Tachyglossus aculeatus]
MMEVTNGSSGGDFIFMGFSDQPQLEMVLFVLILISYLLTLLGNTTIVVVTHLDPNLHTPMYFFLSHLSLVDLCFTTSVIPQLLWNLWGPYKTITVIGCAVQLAVGLALGSTECVLLTIMAFDRYAAICRPLHYMTVMHPRLCQGLAAMAWLSGMGNSAIQSTITLRLPRCGNRHIPNFACEVPTMIKLACVAIRVNKVVLFIATLILALLPIALIVVSYGFIARTALRIKSAHAWRKSLGTCGSHLLVVTLFFGMTSVIYIHPNSSFSKSSGKFLTLFYTVITPTLNPLIYTLRNKDMIGALRRLLGKDQSSGKT